MSRKYKTCPYCNKEVSSFLKHIEKEHPENLKEQKELVFSLWKEGLSSRKISEREDVIFGGGSSVRRVLKKHFTDEELQQGRKKMIGAYVKSAYQNGLRDEQIQKTIENNKSVEGRKKNSEGLKLAYAEGRKVWWNKGKSKKTDQKVADQAKKVSLTMRKKTKSGELSTLLKSGKENPFG